MEPEKKLFAMHVAKGEDPFEAAFDVLGDRMRAVDVYMDWQKDPEIKDYIEKLKQENEVVSDDVKSSGDKEFDDFRRELNEMFKSKQLDFDSRLKAGKMYAEVSGYIKKADTVTNVQVNHNKTPVMIVHRSSSDKEWKDKLAVNQKKLMKNNEKPVDIEIEDVG